ncbi:hypothetical protein Tco_1158403 [Tanacetum coccineum]
MTNGKETTPPPGFLTPPQISNINASERPPMPITVFSATTPENTPFAYRASTLANPNPMISPAFVEANYEDCDKEREMKPRPGPTRETIPPLRPRSPRVRRQGERVVGFKEAPNRKGSRAGRNDEGSRPSEIATRENGNRGMNLPPLLVAYLGRNESGQPLQSSLTFVYGGHQPTTNIEGNLPPNGNSQVKDNKIDLLVQQYEQFVISEDESIDNAFARFNTIITSLKALDEGYSSKNYVRKFLRDLHPKWRAKVTAIEESKDLTSISLDELIWNLKVHEMIIKKDSEIFKEKVERKSFALKAKKESSDEECLTSGNEDKEYAMASNSGEEDDEKVKNETCLVAQASSEVCSESSYFSNENSSIDDLVLDNEYDKLCKMSLKIITKNKRLKSTRNSLEKEISILKEKVSTLKKNKGVDLECIKCHMLKVENEKLKEEALKLTKFEKSTHCLNEMLINQKPSGKKLGLGFNSFEASSSGTKEIKFVKAQKKASSDGGLINMGGPQSKYGTATSNYAWI